MPAAFLTPDVLAWAAAIAAPAAVPSAGVAALRDPQPSLRMRCMGPTASVLVDLGVARRIDCVFWGNTNISAAAQYRIRGSLADPTALAAEALDTGMLAAEPDPFGRGQVVAVLGGAPQVRYLLLDLTDGSLAYIDVGVLAAGLLWRLTRAQTYGFREGRLILDQRPRNAFTAAEFPVRAVLNPRFAAFQIALMRRADAEGAQREMLGRLGAVGDALWVPETALSQAALNARCIWGAPATPGEFAGIERPNFAGFTRAWTFVERG